jgi:hypothetical protein
LAVRQVLMEQAEVHLEELGAQSWVVEWCSRSDSERVQKAKKGE